MATLTRKTFSQVGAGSLVLEAAATDKAVRVHHVTFSVTATTSLPKFQDTDSTDVSSSFGATPDNVYSMTFEGGLFETDSGKGLQLRTVGAGTCAGHIVYSVVDA